MNPVFKKTLALGGHWLSFHAQGGPRVVLQRTLELGFDGIVPCPTEGPRDWGALAPHLAELPVRVPAVRVHGPLGPESGEGGLAAIKHATRQREAGLIQAALRLGLTLQTPRVIADLGTVPRPDKGTSHLAERGAVIEAEAMAALQARYREARDACLDRAVRACHALLAEYPALHLALTGSFDLFGLGEPTALLAAFEDLKHPRLGYWHDAGVAARREAAGLEPAGAWLETLHKWLWGFTLSDSIHGETLLPPGSGGVDYPLLVSYMMKSHGPPPCVVEVDPGIGEVDLRWARASLRKFGL